MTADEAKQALKEGKKVKLKGWKHSYFRLSTTGILRDEHAIDYNYDEVFKDLKDDEWEIAE